MVLWVEDFDGSKLKNVSLLVLFDLHTSQLFLYEQLTVVVLTRNTLYTVDIIIPVVLTSKADSRIA